MGHRVLLCKRQRNGQNTNRNKIILWEFNISILSLLLKNRFIKHKYILEYTISKLY